MSVLCIDNVYYLCVMVHMYVCVMVYMYVYSLSQGFLYKCLGVVMRKTTHKQFVQTSLEMMFSSVKHTSQEEREVLAH